MRVYPYEPRVGDRVTYGEVGSFTATAHIDDIDFNERGTGVYLEDGKMLERRGGLWVVVTVDDDQYEVFLIKRSDDVH